VTAVAALRRRVAVERTSPVNVAACLVDTPCPVSIPTHEPVSALRRVGKSSASIEHIPHRGPVDDDGKVEVPMFDGRLGPVSPVVAPVLAEREPLS
jgi:hypothetical protein